MAAGPKEEISVSFLQEGNETSKQGSSCGSVSQFFFFSPPTVCFFYGRTFCLASLCALAFQCGSGSNAYKNVGLDDKMCKSGEKSSFSSIVHTDLLDGTISNSQD